TNQNSDIQIFALAILLSSTFVYNTMNKIDQGAIDRLHKVTELTNLLRTRNSSDLNETEEPAYVSFFPDLVWTLRDFYLSLEINGHAITSDEYLENSLKLKQGSDERTQAFNLPRQCIQNFFPVKKCFVFDSPAHKNKLSQLQTLSIEELSPEFVQELSEFCSHIFTHSKTKTLPGGIQTLLSAKQEEICKKNVEASADRCSTLLESIFKPLEQEAAGGIYAKPGGHNLFLQKMEQLKAQYRQQPGKGTQAEEMLQKYLKAKEPLSNTVLQTDQALTAKEKERKAEQARAEAARAEAQRLEAIRIQEEQRRAEQERLHQEKLRQIEIDRANFLAQQQRIREQRIQACRSCWVPHDP
ncbi:hypothetical protein A6R68_07514, partial [Neotoma lepida]